VKQLVIARLVVIIVDVSNLRRIYNGYF
jgi:hypothetical protein